MLAGRMNDRHSSSVRRLLVGEFGAGFALAGVTADQGRVASGAEEEGRAGEASVSEPEFAGPRGELEPRSKCVRACES